MKDKSETYSVEGDDDDKLLIDYATPSFDHTLEGCVSV